MAKTIKGTAKADTFIVNESNITLYAGKGNDTITITKGTKSVIHGDAGNDKIYIKGGSSNSIFGDAGKDTFYISKSSKATIKDYTAGSDTLNVTGTITKTTLSKKNMVINVGTGAVTLENAADKNISVVDDRGSYTMSKSTITLGSNFTGTMDAAKLLSTVTKIDGKSSAKTVTIKGNAKANTIYGGSGANKLYGYDGNDKLYGYAGKDTLSGGNGADTLNGGTGNDTLTGGAGKDTFVYASGDGADTVTDYTAGSDTLYVSSGSISKTTLVNSSKDLKFTVGKGSVTLKNAADKTISLKDSRGSYTASNTEIKLGKGFAGIMDAAKFLSTVTKIDGKSSAETVTIKGNANANTIYGGSGANKLYGYDGNDKLYGYAGEDTLSGGNGADTLNGGNGDDTLTGGADKDTFVYASGGGADTVTDYTAGSDTLYVSSGSISKTESANSSNDLKFTIGKGSVTLKNAADKTVSLKDSRGSYTASKTEIKLGKDFTDAINAGKYLSTVTTIDGRAATGAVDITGNAEANVIYASKGGGTIRGESGNDTITGSSKADYLYGDEGDDYLYGGTGDDTLTGGAGKDTFVYASGDGADTVTDYTAGSDTLYVSSGSISKTESANSSNDLVFTIGKGSVTLKNAADKTISLKDSRGSYTVSKTEIKLGKDFTDAINAGKYLSTVTTIDGRTATGAVDITGNAQANTIYASKGGGTIKGESGNDTITGSSKADYLYGDEGNDNLYGGIGDDILTGGEGADLFTYSAGDGNDTITDYEEGNDTVKVIGDVVSNTDFSINGKGVIFAVGQGSITLENAAGKSISLEDSRGNYMVSDTAIILGKDFAGDLDTNAYLSTVTTIDARNAESAVNITGNWQDNTIYAGKAGGTIDGGAGDDTLHGGTLNEILIGGAGDDTLYGEAGNDTLTGGTGNDTFDYALGNGKDIIKDYTEGEDTVWISNGSISKTVLSDSDVVFMIGGGGVTLENASGTTITLKDSRGSYTASVTAITLGKDFAGDMDANAYLSTVTMIDARSVEGTVNITANAQNNSIYAGKAGGMIDAGDGNDTLYGSAGNDILTGGLGNDTFVYASGEGNDIIKDYEENQDTLELSNGLISNTTLSGEDVVFTVGSGTVAFENASGATISLKDSRGSYTASDTAITLSANFAGDMDANVYLSTVTTIDARNVEGTVNITGNAQNNIIYAGKAGGTIDGGIGNDILIGGAGKDIIVYASGEGNDIIKNYEEGQDTLELTNGLISNTTLSGTDVVFAVGSGTVTFENASGATISLKDSRGSYTASGTAIALGTDFIGEMDANAYLSMVKTIDGRNVEGTVNITGNAQNNIIYASKAGGTIDGGAGNDKLYGSIGNDVLIGGAGDDSLEGYEGENTLYGGTGEDELYATGDNNRMYGEEDIDTMEVAGDNNFLSGGAGDDILKVTSGNNNELYGDDGDDELWSISGDNYLYGGDGADHLNGGDGDDHLYGGADNDFIYGGRGNDYIEGGDGNDRLFGDDTVLGDDEPEEGAFGDDTLYGGVGNDELYGLGGNDTLYGGDGNDDLSGDDGNDVLYGEDGEDQLFGGKGNDKLYGGKDNDVLSGDDGDDLLFGDDGIDVIHGGKGNDTLHGGTGVDQLMGDEGDDYLYGDEDGDQLHGGEGNDQLYGGAGNDILMGNEGNDELHGGSDGDFMWGGAGNDRLYGEEGNDQLYGEEGKDTFVYVNGEGNDRILDYEEGEDVIEISGGIITATDDLSDGRILYTIGDGSIEVLDAADKTVSIKDGRGNFTASDTTIILGKDFAGDMDAKAYLSTVTTIDARNVEGTVNVIGNAQDNTIYAGKAGVMIDGDAGNDTIIGGIGNDMLTGGLGNDTFVYASGGGNDTIKNYEEGQDTLELTNGLISNTTLSGTDVVFTVGSGTVTFENASGATISLKDSRGSYTASGAAIALGADYTGDMNANAYMSTVTTIDGRNAEGSVNITGNALDNVIYTGKSSGIIDAGAGNDVLYGDDGNDTLNGGVGNDTLHGGSGDDVLNDGSGDDVLTGGAGKDIFVYSEGNDLITDYAEEDTLQIFDNVISETKFVGENVKFIIGEGSITLNSAADKAITIQDRNGSYTLADQNIVIGSGYTGTIDVKGLLNKVTTIEFSDVKSTDVKFDLEDYSHGYIDSKLCVDTGNGIVKVVNWNWGKLLDLKFSDGIVYNIHVMGNEYDANRHYQEIISNNNVATITNLNNNLVFGGTGTDAISAEVNSNGLCNNNRLHGLGANDTIAANHATNSYFSGGDGADLIRILDGYGNIAEGGAHEDTYELWISNKNSKFSVTIDNSTADIYKDVLVISDKTDGYYSHDSFWDDFNFAKNDEGDLLITGRTFDAEITIIDWDNHPMTKITFEGHNNKEEVIIDGNSIDNLVSAYPENQNIASALLSFSGSSLSSSADTSSDLFQQNDDSGIIVAGNV